jgi:hypothetical protein
VTVPVFVVVPVEEKEAASKGSPPDHSPHNPLIAFPLTRQ